MLLKISLLGSPVIEYNDAPFCITRRQTRALLFRLASQEKPVSREQLCYLFWPDVPETAARRRFSRLLTHLRRALPVPDMIVVGQSSVGLDYGRVWSDAVVSRQLLAAPQVGPFPRRRKLLTYYHGPFLDGFSLPTAPEYETWLLQEQQYWERAFLGLLASFVESYADQGDFMMAVECAQKYLLIDPLAEEMHCWLMKLYMTLGDRRAALRQYDHCRDLLQTELGIDPVSETRAVYEAAHRQRPSAFPASL